VEIMVRDNGIGIPAENSAPRLMPRCRIGRAFSFSMPSTVSTSEILDNTVFNQPPEAEAEENPGATNFVRLSASLKVRCEEAARKDKLSLDHRRWHRSWSVDQLRHHHAAARWQHHRRQQH
jgi:hypothetical protein